MASCALAAEPTASAFKVGVASTEFAADDSMVIAGGIGPGKAVGQEGQLRAVAVVLEHAKSGRFAIVACDCLFVTRAMVDAALVKIEKRCAIPPAHVLVNATHTHSAPSTTRIHGYDADNKFVRTVEQGIVQAVVDASSRMQEECQFAFHLAEEKTVGENSRLRLADDTIYWVGPRDDAVGPTGPFDPQLPVLAFRGRDERLLGVIYNHSTHTIGSLKPQVRSPSFYGLAAQQLEAELGATVCFLEGASGSTHNLGTVTTAEAVERMKGTIRDALQKLESRPVDRVVSLKRPFEFRVRTFDEASEDEKVVSYCRKRMPTYADTTIDIFREMRKELKPHQGETRQTWIQVLVIGDVALCGVPAEFFTRLGMDIKSRSPVANTYVAELANDWIGYLPDEEAHRLGGYQTWMGHHSYAEPGTGERVVDAVVALLREASNESGKP
jgi:neutral ceramidase